MIFANYFGSLGDPSLGFGVLNKLAHAAARITEIRQRTKETTHPRSHLMAAERTGDLSNKNKTVRNVAQNLARKEK